RTDFNVILGQHSNWNALWAGRSSNGTSARCLLQRATALLGDDCSGGSISFQFSGSTTFCPSPAPDAFYSPCRDQHRLLDNRNCYWNWWCQSWLRILGACSHDHHSTPCCHYRFLDRDRLGPGDTPQAGGNSFYAAFWWHSHFERPRSLCSL